MFGRGGPFGSMFGNDPFFSDTFSHMDRMMASMLNDPFFANPFGAGLRPPGGQFLQPVQYARGRQPVIEEVDDSGHAGRTATSRDEPIVEEPDDEQSTQDRAAQRQRRHSPPRQQVTQAHMVPMDPFSQLFGAFNGMGGGGASFMISSSSYSSMGPGGVSYQASSTTRVGPGGVREMQSVVRDNRSNTEAVTISRGLGDGRQRTLVRTRDATTGREEQLEDLHGLHEHEADTFDDQWRQHAERNLPGGGGFGAVSSRLTGGSGGRSAATQQRPLALPHAPSVVPTTTVPSPGSNTAGLYDNTSLSAAQRAAYYKPPSPGAGRVGPPSGGGNTATGAGGNTSRSAVHGSGVSHGSSATRNRSSVLDSQNGSRYQAPAQSAGAGRMPPSSGSDYPAGSNYSHPRYGN